MVQNPVVRLLDAYRREVKAPSLWDVLSKRDVDYLYHAGLSPIALEVLGQPADSSRQPDFELLRDADATIRIIQRQLRDTTSEIGRIAASEDIPLVLIKGIAASEYVYRVSHHRVMGDIDVLAPAGNAATLFARLQASGFAAAEPDGRAARRTRHHHLPALRHRDSGVTVELHTSLFSDDVLARDPIFRTANLWAQTEACDFRDDACLRFTPELELLYTAAHWSIDPKFAINVLSICDVVLMANNADRPIDWALLADWADASRVIAELLAVLLLYLDEAGLVATPAPMGPTLKRAAHRIGATNFALMHRLITTFPLRGSRSIALVPGSVGATRLFRGLMEPRHRMLRIPYAIACMTLGKRHGKSILASTGARLRELLTPSH